MQIRLRVPLGLLMLTVGENEAVLLQTLSPPSLLGLQFISLEGATEVCRLVSLFSSHRRQGLFHRWICAGLHSHCLPDTGPPDSL